MSELISVVVTCFNLERYIGEALESVLGQLEPGPLEVIVVDDCSTDASRELVSRYAGVKLLARKANGGVLNAMLDGVDVASGDVICLLDGDDRWRPNKIATLRRAFADREVAFFTHDVEFIGRDGQNLPIASRPHAVLANLPARERGEMVRTGILEHLDYVWLGSAMAFRRSLVDWPGFEAFAANLPDARNTYQDWPLAFWIAVRPGIRMAYVDEPLFSYRLHGANYSGDASTLASAARNFRRTRNTIAAMLEIARERGCSRSVRILGKHLAFTEGQLALYEGRRGAAVSGYAHAFTHLARRGLLPRELARLAAGVLLGPAGLVRLVNRSRVRAR
ncbi:MAG TPA: glycosyltransferase [Sphingomicrobium sp.]|nr:glycosyltransferase [Sphingomicrobium sp.]